MFTNVWYGGSSVAMVIFLIRPRLCMLIQFFIFWYRGKGCGLHPSYVCRSKFFWGSCAKFGEFLLLSLFISRNPLQFR